LRQRTAQSTSRVTRFGSPKAGALSVGARLLRTGRGCYSSPVTRSTDLDELVPAPGASRAGFDPVVGAGVSLLGLVLMGAGGVRAHGYVFHAGMVVAVSGAALCVLLLALSALRQRAATGE
jgi:hypothetical protein